MRLYKYIAPQWASVLETRLIRFTQPMYFNDPFELAPCVEAAMDTSFEDYLIRKVLSSVAADPSVGSEHYRAALAEHERTTGLPLSTLFPYEQQLAAMVPVIPELMRSLLGPANAEIGTTFYTQLRERIARLFGVLSLADAPNNLLMWAHYGDEHRGVVIGFEKDHSFFDRRLQDQDVARYVTPVMYSPHRPKRTIVYDPGDDEAAFMEELARDFFLVKSPEWSYEHEWRMILPASDASRVTQKSSQEVLLYEFPADAVSDVILGCRTSPDTVETVRRALRHPDFRHVALHRASLHPELFQLVIQADSTSTAG
jgi:hypothetical protein